MSEAGIGARPEGAGTPWGAGLGYPGWFEAVGPRVHDAFNGFNRWFAVPALRMGLGSMMSSPLSGYLMLLRTRGRKSGEWREAPLGYLVQGDALYCLAGFGRRTHWFLNLSADPHVEVILPGRAFSGEASEVTDPEERRRILVPLVRSMGLAALGTGLGNPWRQPPDVIVASCSGFPLVRIRATGIAAGPDDPGGWAWAVPLAGTAVVGLLLARRRARARRRPCDGGRLLGR